MQPLEIVSFISQNLKNSQQITPFLFLCDNLENSKSQILEIGQNLMQEFGVDKNYFFQIPDSEESLKIEQIREFCSKSYIQSPFAFQIFFIENISRLTLQSANSMLKFLEEPGEGNIVFLSNISSAGVLDTILSRVKIINLQKNISPERDMQIYQLIDSYITKSDVAIVQHYFTQNPTRDDASTFLKELIHFIKQHLIHIDLLESIENDISGLENNNLLAKYIIDKYIFLLSGKGNEK